jgi:hypothetical protein
MDDIDLVRQFRGGVPEPGPEVTRAARAAITGELTLGSEPATARRARPRRPTRNRWRIAVGVAAAAVAIAVALPAILPGGGPGGADPAAAEALHRFARIALIQAPGTAPQAGQFVYTKSESVNVNYYAMGSEGASTFSRIQPLTRQAWIGVDGSGRILETTGIGSFPTPADEAAWRAAGSPDLGEGATTGSTFVPGPGGLSFVDLSGLPTDPDELLTVIEARRIEGGPPGDAETFTIVGDLLRETYGPPALRAALYEVAASLPGVELVGETTDASGRPGIAVAYESAGIRDELIFDPQTAALLGETQVATDGASGVPAGTTLSSSVFLVSGVVDSTHETP